MEPTLTNPHDPLESEAIRDVRRAREELARQLASRTPEQQHESERELLSRLGLTLLPSRCTDTQPSQGDRKAG